MHDSINRMPRQHAFFDMGVHKRAEANDIKLPHAQFNQQLRRLRLCV